MNYRHLYHAGNFADVFKHALLTLLIGRLKDKDTAFAVIDTHAGAGIYDVTSPEAQRTGEFARGYAQIARFPWPEALRPYRDAVAALNRDGTLRYYPGSPRLALDLMRPKDRLVACELHPEDARHLKLALIGDGRAEIHHRDGYLALKAFLPPRERRGLVLIDPPFETPDERRTLVQALSAAQVRWPTGIYALWYPIKADSEAKLLHAELANTGIRRQIALELRLRDGGDPHRLNGCGLIVVNPPYRFADLALPILQALHRGLLADDAPEGGTRLAEIAGE